MKTMTCAQMGGPTDCATSFTAETAGEMMDKAWEHMQEAHPDMAKEIKGNSKEKNKEWEKEFEKKFEAAPRA